MQLINIKMHLVLYQKKIEITNEFDVFIILSISSQISPTLFNKGKRLRIFFILKLLTSEVVELITFRFSLYKAYHGAPMVAQMIKNLLQCRRPGFNPWVREVPWRREWLPTLVFMPGEFHEQRSLVGYSP